MQALRPVRSSRGTGPASLARIWLGSRNQGECLQMSNFDWNGAQPDPAQPMVEPGFQPAPAHRPHILVVDDDRGHRLLLAGLLGRGGFRASLAGDARAVLKLIHS